MDSLNEIDLSNAPETKKIVIKIIEIIQYMVTEEIVCLKKLNYQSFNDHMYEKEEFQDFIDKYFSLFTILIGEKIPSFKMLSIIIATKAKVETGELLETDANNLITEFMNNKFIYSKYGGKENFENYIKNKHKED